MASTGQKIGLGYITITTSPNLYVWEKLYVSFSFKPLKWSVCWPVRLTIWHLSLPSPTESHRSLPGDSSTCVCVNNITLASALALRSKVWCLKRFTSLVSTKYASENDTDQNKSEQALIREIYKYSSFFLGLGHYFFVACESSSRPCCLGLWWV